MPKSMATISNGAPVSTQTSAAVMQITELERRFGVSRKDAPAFINAVFRAWEHGDLDFADMDRTVVEEILNLRTADDIADPESMFPIGDGPLTFYRAQAAGSHDCDFVWYGNTISPILRVFRQGATQCEVIEGTVPNVFAISATANDCEPKGSCRGIIFPENLSMSTVRRLPSVSELRKSIRKCLPQLQWYQFVGRHLKYTNESDPIKARNQVEKGLLLILLLADQTHCSDEARAVLAEAFLFLWEEGCLPEMFRNDPAAPLARIRLCLRYESEIRQQTVAELLLETYLSQWPAAPVYPRSDRNIVAQLLPLIMDAEKLTRSSALWWGINDPGSVENLTSEEAKSLAWLSLHLSMWDGDVESFLADPRYSVAG